MEGYISEIRLFAGNFAPQSFMLCQGQLLSITEFTALYSLIGTMYGGDGQQTFGLPDLRGRTPVGSGQGPGLSPIDEGQSGGQESITMITPNMPIHNHTATGVNVTANVTPKAYSTAGTTDSPNGGYLASMAGLYTGPASDDLKMANQTVTGTLQLGMSATGANQPFSNRSPFLGMNFIICVNGIFPSRN